MLLTTRPSTKSIKPIPSRGLKPLDGDVFNEIPPTKARFSNPHLMLNPFDDNPVWDDWHLVEVAHSEIDEREAILNHLQNMLLSSLGNYQEIVDLTSEVNLQSFCEVVIRQRLAQYRDLLQHAEPISLDVEEDHEALAELRAVWRLAIWNFDQAEIAQFAELVEQAEALLEDAFLTVANAFADDEWEQMMKAHAVMVCGVRSVWEDLVASQMHFLAQQSRSP